jgi:hypothetical protein
MAFIDNQVNWDFRMLQVFGVHFFLINPINSINSFRAVADEDSRFMELSDALAKKISRGVYGV